MTARRICFLADDFIRIIITLFGDFGESGGGSGIIEV